MMMYQFKQSRTEEEEAKIRDLEKSLRKEKERSEKFQTDYLTFKVRYVYSQPSEIHLPNNT